MSFTRNLLANEVQPPRVVDPKASELGVRNNEAGGGECKGSWMWEGRGRQSKSILQPGAAPLHAGPLPNLREKKAACFFNHGVFLGCLSISFPSLPPE